MKIPTACCLVLVWFFLEVPKSASLADEATVTLNFPSSDVGEILALYESLTHFKVIRDNFVQGRMVVTVAQPVSPEKAIEVIERTLFVNGFAIIQLDPNTVEIIGAGRNGGTSGVPTIFEAGQLPTQERLVSYLIKFKHVDAKQMQQVLIQYLSPPSSHTSILCAENANALWVTERTTIIRQFIAVAEKMDVPPAQQGQSPP